MKNKKVEMFFSSDEEYRAAIKVALSSYLSELKQLEIIRKEGFTGDILNFQITRLKAAKKLYNDLKNAKP